ncbi:hypothetical protein [Halomarina oriensis]|uniref:Uncharacterized protein n=1 Tax=Halomarina oriensis TaxID=671145 RepID=A0A6B0GQ87_9EURY|nr:hypothetical protein [Halomarina oriensis]MWG36231.1 hypothetical protein [Halomarina oriensis]
MFQHSSSQSGAPARTRGIHRIAEHLHDNLLYVSDANLKREAMAWLETVDSLQSSDRLAHIERELADLRLKDGDEVGEYDMRRPTKAGRDDGESFFPDACQGCPHYGTRCPVFIDPDEREARKRLQDTLRERDAEPVEVQQRYERFAAANNCHQIRQFVNDGPDYSELATTGWELYRRINADVTSAVASADEAAQVVADQQASSGVAGAAVTDGGVDSTDEEGA